MRRIAGLSPLDAEAGARLVAAADLGEFGTALFEIARSVAAIDELFGYIVLDGREPRVLISKSVLPGVDDRVESYVKRFYRHDPAVHAVERLDAGRSFFQRIARSSITAHDYRKYCFVGPGFSEKLSFGWRSTGYVLVLSFYGTAVQGDRALAAIASLANMALALLVRHHTPVHPNDAVSVITSRLKRSFPTLSDREAQICALTIIGTPSTDMASLLGISSGTVLTYRQRAYQKTGLSSAAAMVPAILN